ncbi:hypothetical protein BBF96_07090 [Anoxybacter fermentans]|uniref:Ribosomal RNA small subunit methyltransferase E n=1 Tax=Anoxybacter fermentans TaxID=1323375 RepID=A0A3S9SY40_9FIRM|nr:16S rRNA (uracil(1498)-N(3))-methyltransferase [Anoxybacter fermentans]AZR73170.1 hypothetical protein BBF96_07090 [Anoxybacter fermentans]
MHRFFVKPENIIRDKEVIITGDDVQHITRSLRLKSGDQMIACDGKGTDYLVELIDLNQKEITCRIIESRKSRGEPDIEVTLFQGLPKSDKMDLITQKCTELGIRRIIPVETGRTIVKLNDKKAKRRVERWQKIAYEAAKQSQRGKIPSIGPILNLNEALEMIKKEKYDLFLVPWEEARGNSIRQVLKNWNVDKKAGLKRIAYMIGPEGGLEEKEVQTLIDLGAQPVTLGPRILRTETAGFVVLTVLMYEFLEMEDV